MKNCWFMDYVEIDGLRFFYSPQFHSIMKVNIKEESVEIEKQLLDAEYFLPGKYITMKRFNTKLFLFPLYGQSVCVYDIERKNIEYIQLETNTKMEYSILSSVCVKGKMIGIPGRYSRFIIIDGIDNNKREIEFDREKMNEAKVERSVYFTRGNYVYNNVLFVGSLMKNYIVSFFIDTYKIGYYEFESYDKEKKGIYTLCGNRDELYVLGNDAKLRIYNLLQGNFMLKRVIEISCISLNSGVYASSLYLNGKFIMFSNDGIVICDISSGEAKNYSLNIKTDVDSIVNSLGFLYAYKSDNIIRTMSATDFVEYSLNENMRVIEEKRYLAVDNELCKLNPYSLVTEQKEIYTRNLDFLISCIK